MPTPVTISSFLALSECFCLISATASPCGVVDGCTAPSWVAVPVPAMSGMMASGGMLMAGAGAVVAGAVGVVPWVGGGDVGVVVGGCVSGVVVGGLVGAVVVGVVSTSTTMTPHMPRSCPWLSDPSLLVL